jgi:hypothetical protein
MGLFGKAFGPSSKDKFASMIADAIKKAGETVPLRYDAPGLRLLAEDVIRRFVRRWFSRHNEIPAARTSPTSP